MRRLRGFTRCLHCRLDRYHPPSFRLRAAIVAVLCLTAPGCVGVAYWAMDASATTRDVSEREELWGGYVRNAEYELLEDVYFHVEDLGREFPSLVPPRGVGQRRTTALKGPPIEWYRKNPDAWPEIIGIVEKGTRIKCVRVRKNHALSLGSWVSVVADILDGPYRLRLVNLDDLSLCMDPNADSLLDEPDEAILRRIDAEPQTQQDSQDEGARPFRLGSSAHSAPLAARLSASKGAKGTERAHKVECAHRR